MECLITRKNIGNLCRVCLTSSKNLIHLSSLVEDKTSSIHEMLEIVTLNRVVLNDKLFPGHICQMCLSFLKIARDFQLQFKKSQELLEKVIKAIPVEKNKISNKEPEKIDPEPIEDTKAPVELIFGDLRFDLEDVLVIEDAEKQNHTFEGFLKNLGSEVSAQFVRNGPPNHKTVEEIDTEVTIEPVNRKPPPKITIDDVEFELSRLNVRSIPDQSKIVIEEIEQGSQPGRIIRTLFECPICKRVLKSEMDLELHICADSQSHRFICDKCGHFAHSQSALYHHLQKHKGKRFQCSQCDKKYDSSSRLKTHQQVHKNERPFLCNECGKNFNYAVSLKYHMKLHTGEKKFICNFCGLKFRMPNTLKRHLRTHTKDRPYACGYCDKKFPSRGEMVSHQMLHTGERPYCCEYCGKGFIKSVNLHTHYLSHRGPHGCQLCKKTFIDSKFLGIHTKKVHKEFFELKEQQGEEEYLFGVV